MNYMCEKATGPDKTCTFRTGKIILQQTIEPAQVVKLLTEGKTDLFKGFVSKKTNRKFEAYLILKDGGTAFEFAPRVKKGKAKDGTPKEPAVKIDFTGKEVIGKCPKCGGKVFDTEAGYICERSQADTETVQIQDQQGIIATADRARTGAQAAGYRPDGFVEQIYFQGRPALSRLPGDGRKRQGHI